MESVSAPFAPRTIIQGRYMVEDVLGTGGSSIVYLVRDLQAPSLPGNTAEALFALKALRGLDREDRLRFGFEGDVLKRLHHPALPRIYDVREAEGDQPAFIVLEYIAGSNAETLRRQQPGYHFSVVKTMRLMRPIIEAISYLHHQQPPVIHRDIKPSNILVSDEGQKTFLVDFGISKEYVVDATTTAVRHCTPGYSAPEQYGNHGTDARADVYALGATFYSLLTGVVPADAVQRATSLMNKRLDPLRPVSELGPHIPLYMERAIARAMALGYEQRFASVEDFWAALQGNTPSIEPVKAHSATNHADRLTPKNGEGKKQQRRRVSQLLALLLLALLICLSFISGATGPLSTYKNAHTPQLPLSHATPPSPTQSPFPRLKKTYKGIFYDIQKGIKNPITLMDITQAGQSISGRFIGLGITSTFSGVVDAYDHILLTIPGSAQHSPLFLNGNVRQDGILVGDYCSQDQNQGGQCVANYGMWSVSPVQ